MSISRMVCCRLLLLLLIVAGCRGEHDHDKHDHDKPDELPGQSATVWAERVELFVEYSPLVVGKESAFAMHLTQLPSGKAITAGTASVTVKRADGSSEQATANAPSSPGIFRPVVTPSRAGACELVVTVASPQASETFSAGACEIFATDTVARAKLREEPEPAGRITFLKEQQWKTDFVLAVVGERDLQDGVRASGEIRPVAGHEARIAAPVAGRVELASPPPLLGAPVAKGTVLATIAPRANTETDRATLAAEVTALKIEVDAARVELTRAERLLAASAGPAVAVDEARARLQMAQARYAGAAGRLAQYDASASGGGGGKRFQLRAPIDGTLVTLEVATGETVDEGRRMFDIVDLDRVWLVAQVFEPDVPRVERARSAWFTIEGYEQPFVVDETNSKLVTVGRVVDPKTRTVPVIFEVGNRDGKLRIGNFTKVVIATGAPRRGLAVPESAIIDDAGKAVVYVMVEGEAFERRPLRLGIRSHGFVEVLEGVAAGERVVTKGAYEVRLAAASGTVPAHGHAH